MLCPLVWYLFNYLLLLNWQAPSGVSDVISQTVVVLSQICLTLLS